MVVWTKYHLQEEYYKIADNSDVDTWDSFNLKFSR